MSDSLYDTLGEVVDRFLLRAGIEKKRNFVRYMVLAEECWQDIFQNTLWVVKSVWVPTKSGNPYNYVSVPKDCQRLLSVSTDDSCGLIQPLYYDPQINVIAKPTTKKCGCTCDCSGLCEAVNSMVATTKLAFTYAGTQYFTKTWLQYCPNGDILEYSETPTKKYNNLTGDGGDFNDDYNNDYDIASPPFSDLTIVTVTSQRKICKLEIQPCGCPVDNPENNELFMDCCGYLVNWNCNARRKHCKRFYENTNDNHYGSIKISECNTKIYYVPSHKWRKVYKTETPDWLLLNYQSTGVSCGVETLVPQYARNLMYAMLDCGRKEYNSSFSQMEKDAACYKRTDEKNKIMGFLSPVSLQFLSDTQDARINW